MLYRIETDRTSSPFVFTEDEAERRAVRMTKFTKTPHWIHPTILYTQDEIYDPREFGDDKMTIETLKLRLDKLN